MTRHITVACLAFAIAGCDPGQSSYDSSPQGPPATGVDEFVRNRLPPQLSLENFQSEYFASSEESRGRVSCKGEVVASTDLYESVESNVLAGELGRRGIRGWEIGLIARGERPALVSIITPKGSRNTLRAELNALRRVDGWALGGELEYNKFKGKPFELLDPGSIVVDSPEWKKLVERHLETRSQVMKKRQSVLREIESKLLAANSTLVGEFGRQHVGDEVHHRPYTVTLTSAPKFRDHERDYGADFELTGQFRWSGPSGRIANDQIEKESPVRLEGSVAIPVDGKFDLRLTLNIPDKRTGEFYHTMHEVMKWDGQRFAPEVEGGFNLRKGKGVAGGVEQQTRTQDVSPSKLALLAAPFLKFPEESLLEIASAMNAAGLAGDGEEVYQRLAAGASNDAVYRVALLSRRLTQLGQSKIGKDLLQSAVSKDLGRLGWEIYNEKRLVSLLIEVLGPEQATELFQEAFRVPEGYNPTKEIAGLEGLLPNKFGPASALLELGKDTAILELLDSHAPHPSHLQRLAEYYAKGKERSKGLKVLDEALALVGRVADEKQRHGRLARICGPFAALGQVDKALTIAKGLAPVSRDSALTDICVQLGKDGNLKQVGDIIASADGELSAAWNPLHPLTMHRSFFSAPTNVSLKRSLAMSVAEALAEQNRCDEAVEVAALLTGTEKFLALASIAQVLSDHGHLVEAKRIRESSLLQAKELNETEYLMVEAAIEVTDSKPDLPGLHRILKRAESFERGRQLVAFQAIAKELARLGDIELALQVAERMEPEGRASALCDIAGFTQQPGKRLSLLKEPLQWSQGPSPTAFARRQIWSEVAMALCCPFELTKQGEPRRVMRRQFSSEELEVANLTFDLLSTVHEDKGPISGSGGEAPKGAANAENSATAITNSAPSVATSPGRAVCPQPPYPTSARARGVAGRMTLALQVNPGGTVEKAACIASEGGFTAEEQAGVAKYVERNWSFPTGSYRKHTVNVLFKLAPK